MKNRKNVFGLTGDMGCGKSTIANLLAVHKDIYIFDCDSVAREILEDKKNLEEIKLILGDEIITNNKIDRKKVSQIIFSDQNKKQELESFIHPRVWKKLTEIVNQKDSETIIIVESAILFEIKWEEKIEKIILVTCDKKEQFRRIKTRNDWSDEEIEKRLRNQLLSKIKESKSWAIIDTNCSVEKLKEKTKILYKEVKGGIDEKVIL